MRNTYLIFSFIMLLSVISASAQKYNNIYTPSHNQTVVGGRVNGNAQSVYSVSSSSFSSTSTMPITKYGTPTPLSTVGAVSAPQFSTTTSSRPVRPHRSIGGGSEDDDEEGEGGGQTGGNNGKPENQDDPYSTPLGDAMIPLAVLALAYALARVFLKRKRARSRV